MCHDFHLDAEQVRDFCIFRGQDQRTTWWIVVLRYIRKTMCSGKSIEEAFELRQPLRRSYSLNIWNLPSNFSMSLDRSGWLTISDSFSSF
jgi:hypothetical protein